MSMVARLNVLQQIRIGPSSTGVRPSKWGDEHGKATCAPALCPLWVEGVDDLDVRNGGASGHHDSALETLHWAEESRSSRAPYTAYCEDVHVLGQKKIA